MSWHDTSWAGLQGLVTLRRFRRAPQTAIPVLRNLRGFPWQALTLLKALKVHQAWWVGRGNMGGLVTVDMVRKWWTIERINKKVVWWWCIKEKRRLGTASETLNIWWIPRKAVPLFCKSVFSRKKHIREHRSLACSAASARWKLSLAFKLRLCATVIVLNLRPDSSVLSVAAMGSTFQCLGCLPCECCPGHLQQGPWAWKGGSYSQQKTLMPCSIEWILKWLQLLRVYLSNQ